MTSPYSALPSTASVQERRPTYEDLKRRAEEAGFSGGRGIMDTREWYELCYFTPLEGFMFKALKDYRPSMTNEDVAVCVSTWVYDNSVSRATYEDIKDRLLFVDDNLRGCDAHDARRREEILHAAYKRGYVFAYRIYRYREETEGSGPFIAPRDDIDNFLNELVWRECVENDGQIIDTHGKEAFDELTTILKEAQKRDDRRYAK